MTGFVFRLSIFFLAASVLGWCVDTALRSIRRKRFAPIRRIPFSPLYGIACLVLWGAPQSIWRAPWEAQFLAFAVFICVFEYVAGALILKLRGHRIWDYTDRYVNLHGHTDLFHFFLWGTLGLIAYRWALPASGFACRSGRDRTLSEGILDTALGVAVLLTAGLMAVRRSPRSGLALLMLYGVQARCLIWASRAIDGWRWSEFARGAFLAAMLAVLGHRAATYAFPRPPLPRDRVIVPLVHIAQAWLFLLLLVWPLRALGLRASSRLDAWALGAPLVLSALALSWTHRKPRITRLRVPVWSLSQPLRVVHLSDLHLGPYLSDIKVSWLAEAVTKERGDLIAITGDFLTLRAQNNWSPLLRFVEQLRAPAGVYGCLGNHDVPVADALAADLCATGMTLLRDELVWLGRDGHGRLAVAGLDWRSGQGRRERYASAFTKLCEAAGNGGPAVLLCHNPAVFRLAPQAFGGIMLSGHLHGGQVGFTWGARGASVLRLFGMYDQGLFVCGKAKLYSHRGTGVYGFPLRLGVPAEIAVLDLVPAAEADGA